MSVPITLILSALCGVAFGYAAQRGSLCVVSGIEALLEARSPRVFLSFLRGSVWVAAITLPLAWVIEGEQLDVNSAPTLVSIMGSALFGVGAAINGGCSFGTLIRLGSGDASFIATLAGLVFGFILQRQGTGPEFVARLTGPSPLEAPDLIGIIVFGLAALFCIRELFTDWSRGRAEGRWPPERSAILVGIAGGVLYVLHGTWEYTVGIERALAAMKAGGIPNFDLILIFTACVLGAAIGAQRLGNLRLRLNVSDVPKHLFGGTIMGFAAALIPGGNDALVLHAFPALSPHAPLAYASLVLGAAVALSLSARLRRAV